VSLSGSSHGAGKNLRILTARFVYRIERLQGRAKPATRMV